MRVIEGRKGGRKGREGGGKVDRGSSKRWLRGATSELHAQVKVVDGPRRQAATFELRQPRYTESEEGAQAGERGCSPQTAAHACRPWARWAHLWLEGCSEDEDALLRPSEAYEALAAAFLAGARDCCAPIPSLRPRTCDQLMSRGSSSPSVLSLCDIAAGKSRLVKAGWPPS